MKILRLVILVIASLCAAVAAADIVQEMHLTGKLMTETDTATGNTTLITTSGSGSLSGSGCRPTAASPTYIEAVVNYLSCTIGGALRVYLDGLIEGEDQPNHLLMTSGGAVRQTNIGPAVSTNTTGAVFAAYTGIKTFQGRMVCNAGASTDCGITFEIRGNSINSTTGSESLCTTTIPTGTATLSGTCPGISTPWPYVFFITTGKVGTNILVDIYMNF